ncbi:4-hydroxybenzoate octaprenyltransferase [Edwardsiella piscicida]|uniref:4-hydroxybenzoate octaprenyltransferase n=1 Tax=Edwardsiella piscicida TaxID=1263550 RepID=UPI001570FFAC|nr:4-hydroxybenzoate octaprenyltransferase [Edwardsiella piscicida]EKS7814650.1 4-hydroxybenzoate octaprenyltransferase [Edwardsiella piscicida]WAM44906.1 4-hydroxybenzoate octaprenyltransferase [Edwardsiella piscicida]
MDNARKRREQGVEGCVTQSKWLAYCRLMRIDKPIGSLLLLWPTYWALWLAGGAAPGGKLLLVFTCGVFFMRAAGCVINDFADRHFDGHVKRTCQRPLPCGALSEREAKTLFVLLVALSFALVLTLNAMTIWLSVAALTLAWLYPFMKRFSHLPQVILGMAFGWSIPMAYAAVGESLPLSCWLLFAANICWTVAYDTQYAMVDRDDDLRIGIKSTAILFGRYDRLMIGLLQFATLLLLLWVGDLNQLQGAYYWGVLLAAALFVYQQRLIVRRARTSCFRAFMNNNYVGLILFLGILLAL